jgi:hypothetical protein
MAKRQTIKVQEFKKYINSKLALSTISQDAKAGLCVILEHYLHETGNYKGYGHANPQEQAKGWSKDSEYDRHYY